MKLLKILGIIFFLSFAFVTIKGFVGGNETDISIEAAISGETEPQKIAREMVEQQMSKEVGLEKWEITSNKIVSDKTVNNTGDYDKPLGEQRVVWVEGFVEFTTKSGNTASDSYSLELYQMTGDSKWYINNHWGVLRNLVVTEKPDMKNDGRSFSDNEDINPPKPSQQTTSELEASDEEGVYNALVNYENARIEAINNGDFETVAAYLLPNSILSMSDQKEINTLHGEGITAQLNMFNIESIQKVDENIFEAQVYEEIILQESKTSRWVYTVQKSNGQYLLSNVRE